MQRCFVHQGRYFFPRSYIYTYIRHIYRHTLPWEITECIFYSTCITNNPVTFLFLPRGWIIPEMNWLNARAVCCISIRHTRFIDSPARHTQVHVHGESVNHRFNEGSRREMLRRGGVEEKEEGVTWFTMRWVTLRNWMTSEMYAPPC